MSANQPFKGAVLNSWKEIASYLGRGVRTVQRYEQDLGLPVRRPSGKSRSAVIALTEDLDFWLRQTPSQNLVTREADSDYRPTAAFQRHDVRRTVADAAELRERCHKLREAHAAVLTALIENVQTTLINLRETKKLKSKDFAELASAECDPTNSSIARSNSGAA